MATKISINPSKNPARVAPTIDPDRRADRSPDQSCGRPGQTAGQQAAEPVEYLRSLYRQSLLSECEFEDRIKAVKALQLGDLVPPL